MTNDSLIRIGEETGLELLGDLYRGMITVRGVETTLQALFAEGVIPGFLHLSIGQEAAAVGVGKALRREDTVSSTHRGHGHCVAKGMELTRFFAELLGSQDGACKGRGGSMHVADMEIGMLGANGIVAAGIPIALGSALAHKVMGRPAISVAFFGDGAQAEGALHETLNLAKAWSVPLLLVCEDNGWSEFTPSDRAFVGRLEKLAEAFDLSFSQADGNDVMAVHEAAAAAVEAVRASGTPAILRLMTQRVTGHFAGDPQKYRPDDSRQLAIELDPIARCKKEMKAAGVKKAELDRIQAEVTEEIDRAMSLARQSQPAVLDFSSYQATSSRLVSHG